jgi:hypothetical protein
VPQLSGFRDRSDTAASQARLGPDVKYVRARNKTLFEQLLDRKEEKEFAAHKRMITYNLPLFATTIFVLLQHLTFFSLVIATLKSPACHVSA